MERVAFLDLLPGSNAAPDTVRPLCGKGTLLPHGELDVHQDPQGFYCKTAFQSAGFPVCASAQSYSLPGADFAFPSVQLHGIPAMPFLQCVQVPLKGNTDS